MKKEANKYSNFWLVNRPNAQPNIFGEHSVTSLLQLADYRGAIANFVKIVTGRDIPVKYSESDESFTDGVTVVISAEIHEDSFDSTVGLALHEGSHILLSEFDYFENTVIHIPNDVFNLAKSVGIEPDDVKICMKDLVNWIEDRRIDEFIRSTSPGYVGYYDCLYDRYFNSDDITEAMEQGLKREECLDDYFFHIVNMTNTKFDSNALVGLKDICKLIDLQNISRLKSTKECFEISLDVFKIILLNIKNNKKRTKKDSSSEEAGAGKGKGKGKSKGKNKNGKSKIGDVTIGDGDDAGEGTPADLSDLNDKEMKELLEKVKKALEKQKDFLSGKIDKKKLNKNDAKKLDLLKGAGSIIVPISYDPNAMPDDKSDNANPAPMELPSRSCQKVDVLVIKNVTDEIFNSDFFKFATSVPYQQDSVNEGIVLGTMLGKKLQIRNEEKITQFSRKKTGAIERRLLSELGHGNTDIFQQTIIEAYTKAIMHISIDCSGSMNGYKFSQCIVSCVAMAKAATMTRNLDVVISLRGTMTPRSYSLNNNEMPMVAVIYDSRRDKFSKIRRLFPRLCVSGTTPEGLCFAAIQEMIESTNKNVRSYFINFSDGEPFYLNYTGEAAALQTKSEVDKMRAKGLSILSYFIESYYAQDTARLFKLMYGKDAQFIDVKNIVEVARTLNKMFLSDEQKILIGK